MPLNSPALSLDVDAEAVPQARRWVGRALHDLDRDDLCECGELGTSELVTNAVLHAHGPLTVRLRGTRRNPRIEVADGLPEPPNQPAPLPQDLDSLLVTFGRGLSIVARCSVAWGTTIEPEGKIVWFEPAAEPAIDATVGVVLGAGPGPQSEPEDPSPVRRVRIDDVPVPMLDLLRNKYRELRRELLLLSLAHAADYPLASRVTEVFVEFERVFPEQVLAQVDTAIRTGVPLVTIDVEMAESAAAVFGRMRELLDLADDFCQSQRLLVLARTPEQADFQRWWLGEFEAQSRGQAASAWRQGSTTG